MGSGRKRSGTLCGSFAGRNAKKMRYADGNRGFPRFRSYAGRGVCREDDALFEAEAFCPRAGFRTPNGCVVPGGGKRLIPNGNAEERPDNFISLYRGNGAAAARRFFGVSERPDVPRKHSRS